jgi:hypothetical protein
MDAEFLSDFGTVPGEVQRSERVQVRLGWLDFLLGQALQQEQQRLQEKLKQLHEAQQERQQAAPLWRK